MIHRLQINADNNGITVSYEPEDQASDLENYEAVQVSNHIMKKVKDCLEAEFKLLKTLKNPKTKAKPDLH